VIKPVKERESGDKPIGERESKEGGRKKNEKAKAKVKGRMVLKKKGKKTPSSTHEGVKIK